MNKRIRVGLSAGISHGLVVVAVLFIFAGRAFNASAQMETVLYSFGNSTNDGAYPQAGLVQGGDGNFYGTTTYGGGGPCVNPYTNGIVGCGTVFRISPSGNETNLYSFGSYLDDGTGPQAGLAQGSNGDFYGTTIGGGTSNNGTVFRIGPGGSYANLYSFKGVSISVILPLPDLVQGSDGSQPEAGLVQGSDGNFYGTTFGGGTMDAGTVFRISPSGSETILHSFGYSDGAWPQATLVQGGDSNFYGTTFLGGTHGGGTVFRISPSGTLTTLYSFSGGSDGAYPQAGLVQGSDGNFYGTTEEGGMYSNYFEPCQCYLSDGVVFRISPSGSETNLYSFGSHANDGFFPYAGLIQDSDGNFYGTTLEGGTSTNCDLGCGTAFRISPSGSLTTLWSFTAGLDGARPVSGLVQGTDGSFYGTTAIGGTYNQGTVFKLCVPSGQPPVISDVAVTPNVLWPPNHKMVLVTVDYTTTENCEVADCELSATSNESNDSSGDGDSANDIQLIPGDSHHVYLRAERSPSGSGRVYTITCTDTSGNVATKTAEVTVPHDQGEN